MIHNVLVFGATGNVGSTVVYGLLNHPDQFNVFAAVRPNSIGKPIVKTLAEKGATIVSADIEGPREILRAVLKGMEIAVSAVFFRQISFQADLCDLAKEAGVQRFIPCDFGTVGLRGNRLLMDLKYQVHDHIENIGLGHTYIDMGWWMQNTLPSRAHMPTLPDTYPQSMLELPRHHYTDVAHRTIYTDLRDLESFIGPMLADPRTLNKYVLIWGEEVTQKQIWDLYREVVSEDINVVPLTCADIQHFIDSAPQGMNVERSAWEYIKDMWVLGLNTVENSKKPEFGEALDAKELYPDLPVRTLYQYAKETF